MYDSCWPKGQTGCEVQLQIVVFYFDRGSQKINSQHNISRYLILVWPPITWNRSFTPELPLTDQIGQSFFFTWHSSRSRWLGWPWCLPWPASRSWGRCVWCRGPCPTPCRGRRRWSRRGRATNTHQRLSLSRWTFSPPVCYERVWLLTQLDSVSITIILDWM